MKTKKLTQKGLMQTAVKATGLVLGFLVGGAISAAVPQQARTVTRIGVAGGGLYAHTVIEDDNGVGSLVKYAAGGAAVREAYGLVTDQLQKVVNAPTAESSVVDRAIAGAVGLACPSESDYFTNDQSFLNTGGSLNRPMAYTSFEDVDDPVIDVSF